MPLGGETIRPQAGQEDRRPLHTFGLVNRRQRHGIGRRVTHIGVGLRVVAGCLVLQPRGEYLVLLPWLGVEVDLLEVGDRLAELPELEEDQLAPDRLTGDGLLADSQRLQKLQVEALDVVHAPSLASVEVAAFVKYGECVRPGPGGRDKSGVVPETAQVRHREETNHVTEDPDDSLDFRTVEEPIESFHDVRDVPAPHLLD